MTPGPRSKSIFQFSALREVLAELPLFRLLVYDRRPSEKARQEAVTRRIVTPASDGNTCQDRSFPENTDLHETRGGEAATNALTDGKLKWRTFQVISIGRSG